MKMLKGIIVILICFSMTLVGHSANEPPTAKGEITSVESLNIDLQTSFENAFAEADINFMSNHIISYDAIVSNENSKSVLPKVFIVGFRCEYLGERKTIPLNKQTNSRIRCNKGKISSNI